MPLENYSPSWKIKDKKWSRSSFNSMIRNNVRQSKEKMHLASISTKTPIPDDPLVRTADKLLDATRKLWEKRKSFNEQMLTCSDKRAQLKNDMELLHERKVKSESIVRDNDAKRWRALQKFCEDNHLCSVRKKEKHMLSTELRKTKQLYASLSAKAADLRKYEKYMLDVIASLPKDYIKLADNVIAGLMMRYNTLYETNSSLRKEMEAKSEEVRIAQTDLRHLIETHRALLFGKNSELAELYGQREKINDSFQGAEQALNHSHDELLHQLAFFETVTRAINNLTGKLIRSYEPHLVGQQLITKVQTMPILSRCRLIGERTLAIRDIISQLATDTGTLPISTCCRPELGNEQGNAMNVASTSEFTLLSKVTSAQSEQLP